MKQLNMIDDLGWLLDKDWTPKNVTHYISKESRRLGREFDEVWATSMGYKSISHLNEHNIKRDRAYYLKYGDRLKGLI